MSDYPAVFVSPRPSWKNRVGHRCRFIRYCDAMGRKIEIEFSDGVRTKVHVLAIRPSPLQRTKEALP